MSITPENTYFRDDQSGGEVSRQTSVSLLIEGGKVWMHIADDKHSEFAAVALELAPRDAWELGRQLDRAGWTAAREGGKA